MIVEFFSVLVMICMMVFCIMQVHDIVTNEENKPFRDPDKHLEYDTKVAKDLNFWFFSIFLLFFCTVITFTAFVNEISHHINT